MLATVLFSLLTAINLPIVGDLAAGSLEWRYPPGVQRPDDVQAIVVLCGYVRPPDEWFPEAEIGQDTTYRCLHAAALYRRGKPCPVIVSGGKVPGTAGPSMAQTMKAFLVADGIPETDVIMEDQCAVGL